MTRIVITRLSGAIALSEWIKRNYTFIHPSV